MKFLLIIFTCFLFFGCNGDNGSQLKQEVLDKAGECGEDVRKEYDSKIQEQEKLLNSDQLQQSLQKMKELIKC